MRAFLLLSILLAALDAAAQPRIFPLADVKKGMKGTGRSVFQGGAVEEFGVEILGILENVGPKQSIILARLSGGPMDRTGVMQGMSGSPVYLDGRLAGAVAFSFPFSKEPIAGIRPIEEMLKVNEALAAARAGTRLPPLQEVSAGGARLVEIATPLSFGGFTRATLDHFAPQLRAAGLEPVQGIAAGGRLNPALGTAARLEPGSMISVLLMTGDLSTGADGTVTAIDGATVYAFGHRFLSVGPTEMPFARAEVITLLPSVQSSFKITEPKEWMGAITQDRNVAIAGEIGRKARTIPARITLRRGGKPGPAYQMELADDRLMTPLLLQMAVFSAIDATERSVGASTIALAGRLNLVGGEAPVRFDNIYSGDMGAPQMVSAGAVAALAYLMQGGFSSLQVQSVEMEMDVQDGKRQLTIDNVYSSRREVRPGEGFDLFVSMTGENGAEVTRSLRYNVPAGEQIGTLNFTVCDAMTANVLEYRQFLQTPPRTPAQMLSFLNGIRGSTKAYVRVWRPQPSFQVQGETLPDPPPSMQLLLGKTQTPTYGARITELEIPGGDAMVTGAKTISVEVKE